MSGCRIKSVTIKSSGRKISLVHSRESNGWSEIYKAVDSMVADGPMFIGVVGYSSNGFSNAFYQVDADASFASCIGAVENLKFYISENW